MATTLFPSSLLTRTPSTGALHTSVTPSSSSSSFITKDWMYVSSDTPASPNKLRMPSSAPPFSSSSVPSSVPETQKPRRKLSGRSAAAAKREFPIGEQHLHLVYNGVAVITAYEPVTEGRASKGARFIVRDMTGKYIWDYSPMNGLPLAYRGVAAPRPNPQTSAKLQALVLRASTDSPPHSPLLRTMDFEPTILPLTSPMQSFSSSSSTTAAPSSITATATASASPAVFSAIAAATTTAIAPAAVTTNTTVNGVVILTDNPFANTTAAVTRTPLLTSTHSSSSSTTHTTSPFSSINNAPANTISSTSATSSALTYSAVTQSRGSLEKSMSSPSLLPSASMPNLSAVLPHPSKLTLSTGSVLSPISQTVAKSEEYSKRGMSFGGIRDIFQKRAVVPKKKEDSRAEVPSEGFPLKREEVKVESVPEIVPESPSLVEGALEDKVLDEEEWLQRKEHEQNEIEDKESQLVRLQSDRLYPERRKDVLEQILGFINDSFPAEDLLVSPKAHKLRQKQTLLRVSEMMEKRMRQRKDELKNRPAPVAEVLPPEKPDPLAKTDKLFRMGVLPELQANKEVTSNTEPPSQSERACASEFDHVRAFLSRLYLGTDTRASAEILSFLPDSNKVRQTLKLLDTTPGRECYRVGVIFVEKGQDSERELFMNERGSQAYDDFLGSIGWEVDLATHAGFMGKLDPHLTTGQTSLYFCDSFVELMYHVITAMPTSHSDPQQLHKKRHVSNDHVHIVWTEHSRDYRPSTISSQFNHVHIVIYPLQGPSWSKKGGATEGRRGPALFRVQIFQKDGVPSFGPLRDGMVVSKALLGPLVRITALNACRVCRYGLQGVRTPGVSVPPYATRQEYITKMVNRYEEQLSAPKFLSKFFLADNA